jgi:hypothetical protein
VSIDLRGWRRLFRFWRADPAADVDAELRFHFEQKVADLVARGRAPDDARAQAEAEFGDVDAVRTNLRAIDDRIAQRRDARSGGRASRRTSDMCCACSGARPASRRWSRSHWRSVSG